MHSMTTRAKEKEEREQAARVAHALASLDSAGGIVDDDAETVPAKSRAQSCDEFSISTPPPNEPNTQPVQPHDPNTVSSGGQNQDVTTGYEAQAPPRATVPNTNTSRLGDVPQEKRKTLVPPAYAGDTSGKRADARATVHEPTSLLSVGRHGDVAPDSQRPLPPPPTEQTMMPTAPPPAFNVDSHVSENAQLRQQITELRTDFDAQRTLIQDLISTLQTQVTVNANPGVNTSGTMSTAPHASASGEDYHIKQDLIGGTGKRGNGPRLPPLRYKMSDERNTILFADWKIQLSTYFSGTSPRYGAQFCEKLDDYANAAFKKYRSAAPEDKLLVFPEEPAWSKMEDQLHHAVAEDVIGQLPLEAQTYAQSRAALENRKMRIVDGLFLCYTLFCPTVATQRTKLRATMRKTQTGLKNSILLAFLFQRSTDISRLIANRVIDVNEDFTEYFNVVKDATSNCNEQVQWHLNKFFYTNPEPCESMPFSYFTLYLSTITSLVKQFQPQYSGGEEVPATGNGDDSMTKGQRDA